MELQRPIAGSVEPIARAVDGVPEEISGSLAFKRRFGMQNLLNAMAKSGKMSIFPDTIERVVTYFRSGLVKGICSQYNNISSALRP